MRIGAGHPCIGVAIGGEAAAGIREVEEVGRDIEGCVRVCRVA